MKLLIRSTRPTLTTSKADDECESLPFQEDFFLLLHCFLMKGKPGAKVILEVVEKAKAKESQRAREEKGKGSGDGFRRSFDNRRPMFGLRRPTTSSSSTTIGDSPKSTLSGSTATHGPRFKRYRVQANGVKEVPEDQVTMVDDLSMDLKQEECDMDHVEAEFCFFTTMIAGKAIVDLGATRTITRESTWKLWLEHLDP